MTWRSEILTAEQAYLTTTLTSMSNTTPGTHDIVLEIVVQEVKSDWMKINPDKPWTYLRFKYEDVNIGTIGEQEIIVMDCRELL